MADIKDNEAAAERTAVDRARHGDQGVFDNLYQLHAATTWRLALVVQRDTGAAAQAVVQAFAKVLGAGDHERTTTIRLRARLLTEVRAAALDTSTVGPGVPLAVGRARPEGDGAARAFQRLPERWRTALWLTKVEGLDATAVATVLASTPSSAAELTERAEAGLHEQFTQAQVASATHPDCQRTAVRLGGYVAGTLTPRDEIRVRRHLDRCAECQGRLDDVDDLIPRLRRSVPVVPAAVFGLATQAWADTHAGSNSRLGLTLPGGRPLPLWAERTLAGATAAVITLGITGAILAGGRGKERSAPLARNAVELPLGGTADGEGALGGAPDPTDGPLVDDLDLTPDPTGAPTGSPAGNAGATPTPGPTSAPETPRGSTVTPPPAPPAGPNPPAGPGPVDPPLTPPTTAAPLVAVRVTDDIGVSVGGECTGVEVLGVVLLCDPPPGTTLPLGLG